MKEFIGALDRRFSVLHNRSGEIVRRISPEFLYRPLRQSEKNYLFNSCGEYVLRSAGRVEQTFGGITVKLWDDPFEWALPERLSTREAVLNYLDEVEATRLRGFALFRSDEDLRRELPAPDALKTIFSLLIETLAVAENFQGRAVAAFGMFSDEKV